MKNTHEQLPDTIKYPKTFLNSPSAGFDGIFDWSFTKGCFGNDKMTPSDVDGIVERKGNFIVFETKGVDVPVPMGQMILLKSLYALGCFTIVIIQGKMNPEKAMCWCPPDFKNGMKMNTFDGTVNATKLHDFTKSWYEYAEANSKRKYL